MEREGVRRHGSALVPASDASNKQLGRAVKQLPARRGLSQEDLAHASGLHPTYISGIERGLRNPTWRSLSRLCEALGVKLSELAALAESLDDRGP
jgi:transcriptional regulator with XRE-family HTH domain